MQSTVSISPRTLWSITGLVALLALSWFIAVSATKELVLIFGAIVVAEGIRPPVMWMTQRRIPMPLAITLIYVIAFTAIGLMSWVITAPLAHQFAQLIDEAPQLTTRAEQTLSQYQQLFQSNEQLHNLLRNALSQIGAFIVGKATFFLQAPVYLVGLISNTFLLLLISFFWLTASSELSNFVLSLHPPHLRKERRMMFDEMSTKMGGYVRGVLINMIVIGLLSGLGVRMLGVQFTFILGVVAGLTESIPIIGPLLGGAVATIVALLTLGTAKAVQVALLYLVIQQVEGNTLVPIVMNRAVNLHPLAIIIALLIGSSLLGIPGAILSLPAAAVIQVLILHLVAPALRNRKTDSASESSVDPTPA